MTDHHGFLSEATAPIYGEAVTRLHDRPEVTRQIEFVAVSIGRKEPLTLYPAEFAPGSVRWVLASMADLMLSSVAFSPSRSSSSSTKKPPSSTATSVSTETAAATHSRHSRHSGLSLFRHWGELLGIA